MRIRNNRKGSARTKLTIPRAANSARRAKFANTRWSPEKVEGAGVGREDEPRLLAAGAHSPHIYVVYTRPCTHRWRGGPDNNYRLIRDTYVVTTAAAICAPYTHTHADTHDNCTLPPFYTRNVYTCIHVVMILEICQRASADGYVIIHVVYARIRYT